MMSNCNCFSSPSGSEAKVEFAADVADTLLFW